MKKYDSLLKKAEVFEKLALYGDRKAFLRAIAQAAPLSNDIREGIDSALKDLSATKPDSSQALQNRLMDFYQGTNTDLNQLVAALRDAANTIPGTNTTQVQRIMDLANKVQQMSAPQTEGEPAGSSKPVTMPADRITGYAPIPKDVQEHLSNLVTMRRWGIPLRLNDGKIGPDTKAALDAFKKNMKLDPNTPNAQVFSLIEKEYAKDNPTTVNLDEAARLKDKYDKEQSFPPGTLPNT